MTDSTSTSPDAHADAGPNIKVYLGIFVILSICTLMSFVVNHIMGQNHSSMLVILLISVVKTLCVGGIFMHLKYEWNKLYFLIIPVFILGVMMMMVLLPDIVIDWHHDY